MVTDSHPLVDGCSLGMERYVQDSSKFQGEGMGLLGWPSSRARTLMDLMEDLRYPI